MRRGRPQRAPCAWQPATPVKKGLRGPLRAAAPGMPPAGAPPRIPPCACARATLQPGAGVCGVLDLLLGGKVPQKGFVRMEDVSYDDFMATPFGRYYGRRD